MEVLEIIILIGVTVSIAIALALFASNITSPYMQTELIDISYVILGNQTISIQVKNKGPKPVSIVAVKADGKYYPQNIVVTPGEAATLRVQVEPIGVLHEIRIVLASGTEYPLLVKL
ncbi:MAG: hypothetical protein ACPLRJ_00510 [Infirmifilum uzonense]|uniref:hypothetical protein n=1 Tax=Infirmifilum uzonense TaxID=1550241 RepID=UPI003C768532